MLRDYRMANKLVAKWRDDARCQMCCCCGDEIDHVFGRGSKNNLLREHWALMMALCRPCHHQKHHGGGFDRVEQAKRLQQSNKEFLSSGGSILCLSAINSDMWEVMADDLESALDFLDDWLARNG